MPRPPAPEREAGPLAGSIEAAEHRLASPFTSSGVEGPPGARASASSQSGSGINAGPSTPLGVNGGGRFLLALPVLALCLATGCADQCARGQDVSTRFALKASACGVSAGAAFDVKACQASLASCSASELSQVDRYLDCLDALPTCTGETSASFSAKVLACANDMLAVRAACFVLDP